MTRAVSSWNEIPRVPAVHAMYGGEPPRTWVAYVGMAGDVQSRLIQHFVQRDSSVVTGSSAVGVNIELVRFVDWWEHPDFGRLGLGASTPTERVCIDLRPPEPVDPGKRT